MATSATPAPTIEVATTKAPNKFLTFLQKVGHDFENGLNFVLTDVSRLATAEAPALSVINPAWGALATQIGSLSTQALAIVTQTEQKFTALGQSTGTGVQKFAEATAILAPAVAQVLGLAGVNLSTATAALVNGAVGILNAIPADIASVKAASAPVPETAATA